MSFKNFLDLRKKTPQQIQIIEKIILQKRSLKSDLFLALSVILVASGIIWGISKADTVIQSITKPEIKNFTAVGIVLSVDSNNLYIDQAKGSDDPGKTNYVFDIPNSTKIETSQYKLLSLSDIKIGERVIVQGQEDGGNIYVKRIISFGVIVPTEEKKVDVATSTSINLDAEDLKKPAEAVSTTTATSIESISTTTPTIIETVKDKILNVIDLITGNSADINESSVPQNSDIQISNNEIISSTTVPVNISSTTDMSSSTAPATSSETIIETVGGVINDVVTTVTATVQTVTETVQTVIENITQTNLQPENIQTE